MRMQIPEPIRRFTYSPVVAAGLRRLGLRKVLQSAYARLRGSPSLVTLSLQGFEGLFASRTPQELRCIEGTWYAEKQLLSGVLASLRAGEVFMDVGSNLGLFSIFAAKAVGLEGTVVAFEPETAAYNRLVENVRLNGLQNVRIFKIALSDGPGKKKLALGDPEAATQSAHLAEGDGPSEVVDSSDYDSLATKHSFPIPRAVKMDIEGHEFAALNGMRATLSSPSCVALFCEVHPLDLPKGIKVQDVVALVESFGFDSVRREDRGEQVHVMATKGQNCSQGVES
jgi:FkbM family methyltransferase